ncbi:uncharacterized protein CcaverHIS019_0701580 [Cutaneotrichosporon cavernicola]|uniref:DUS-like FMN-binding domain-containing protein n=1 Tax=Cutaneotrichosporon cavernicola TaxID=279322 RepID=A0AA48L9Z6_9TREE|nr:uncharacterized protein CcaverHIS019_0701580 [Cutaneotrichosporon cavernicola]BEI94586.1 hypothetical protein CcaverHIS019_0701580 [Cutaneotrichosporon cavernicola]
MLFGRLTAALNRLRLAMTVAVHPASPITEPAAKRMRLSPEMEGPQPAAIGTTVFPKPPNDSTASLATASTDSSPQPKKKKSRRSPKAGDWSIVPTSEQEVASAAACEETMSLPFELERSYAHELVYSNKLVLAPMVRSGVLPARLLSLYYGAGLVWTPEIVDKAIIGAQRSVDPETGIVTYHKGQGAIWTTHPIEKPFVIFQIGSSDPKLAAEAAKVVEQDVSGIDLNCGCPKPFSTHSGMGAALLSTPDLLLDILRSVLRAVDVPVSCKIRLLAGQQDTRHLASRILRTGVRNLTVHCRTRDMRPRERAIWDRLRDIVELGERRGVNVICNGDGEGAVNWEKIKEETGASSAMLARSAENNPSVFRPEGPVDNLTQVVPRLLNIAEYTKCSWGSIKFLLMQYRPSPPPLSTISRARRKELNEVLSRAKSVEELAENLKIELGQGKTLFDELDAKLRARPEWAVWEASRAGSEVVDPKPAEVQEAQAEEGNVLLAAAA